MVIDVRKQILKQRGVSLKPYVRSPATADEIDGIFKKSPLMRYAEIKTGQPIEKVLAGRSLNRIVKYLAGFNIEIDRSTISKWRSLIKKAYKAEKDRKFWDQF